MPNKSGNLSINSENIFPIIKKWLYSDSDIFYRELISNGCDAITKLKKMEVIGEYTFPEGYKPRITVRVNPTAKTVSVEDNGIGMTFEEVDEYINQIAFSGAADFLEKYKDKTDKDQIIGHFGLGFYSCFMVADEVEIDTLSCNPGAEAVHWSCDGGTEFSMEAGTRTEVGTKVTLHLSEDHLAFANEYEAREVIEKYCSFMPVEIFLENETAEQQYETIDADQIREDDVVVERFTEPAKTEEREKENGEKETVEISPARERAKINRRPVSLSDTTPLWTKHPNDCTEEEYKTFYRHVFHDYKEPLFWIHLNMEYPFHLKGILYFPKINTEYDSIEGTIKLYNNQVFIADNIKEVIPEFLLLLKGVIDCPDLPLNVSRSALQNDGFVKKIADYISRKVADKLTGMCKVERENYEKYWDDIHPFLKYGCLKDEKFCDRMMDYILYKDLDGKYLLLSDLVPKPEEEAKAAETAGAEDTGEQKEAKEESANPEPEATAEESGKTKEAPEAEPAEKKSAEEPANPKSEAATEESGKSEEAPAAETAETEVVDENGESEDLEEEEPEKKPTILYYVTDPVQQSQYIKMFKEQGQNAVIMETNIDPPFMSLVESKREDIKFQRIDADLTDTFREEGTAESLKDAEEKLSALFNKQLQKEKLTVKVERLKNANVSAMITLSEESRRMQEMMRIYGMSEDGIPEEQTLVLNANHELVQYLLNADPESELCGLLCHQLYDMAQLAYKPLQPDEMTAFMERSNQLMLRLTKEQSSKE